MKAKTQSKTKARTKAGLIDANGSDALRAILAKACAKTGSRQSDLTVLSAAVDPYRLDTDAGHRDARWVAEQLDRLLAPEKHYLLISTTGLIKSFTLHRSVAEGMFFDVADATAYTKDLGSGSAVELEYPDENEPIILGVPIDFPGGRLR
jgi:hypothetical protein